VSKELNQCCSLLKEEVKAAEKYLLRVTHTLESATETGVEAMESRLKNAVCECEAESGRAAEAARRTKDFGKDAANNALNRIEDWKADREIAKIEKEADKKEKHALDAIVVAAFAIMEAEVASMEALKARKFAIEVAG
jgi:hypothetical protein